MAARGGGANQKDMGRDKGIRGLKDLSSVVQGNSLVLQQLRVAAPIGPQPNPVTLTQHLGQVQPERMSLGPARLTHMWGKVCVGLACSVYDPVYGPENCCIYIVDLDEDGSDEWSFKAPTIRFNSERFDFEAFCVLGDSLYIFEYYHPYDEYKGGRRVWKYKLPVSPDIVNQRLEESDLLEVSPMKCPKLFPEVTSTPDGKILVFSTCFIRCKKKIDIGDFELYDPHEQLWEQLPGLSFDSRKYIEFKIYAFAFLNNEPVLVLNTSFGMFNLDFRPSKDKKEWKRFVELGDFRPRRCAHEFILFRDFYMNSSLAYELVGKEHGSFEYPQLMSRHNFQRNTSSITLLRLMTEGRGFFFCTMDTRTEVSTMIPHLVISVYRFDYTKFKKHLQKGKIDGRLLPCTKVLKTFKFRLTPQRSDRLFRLCFNYVPKGNN